MLLELRHLTKVYRRGVRANDDISLTLDEGEVVTLIGRTGAGTTPTLRSSLGITAARRGHGDWSGTAITRLPPHARAPEGLAWVPEGGRGLPARRRPRAG